MNKISRLSLGPVRDKQQELLVQKLNEIIEKLNEIIEALDTP